MNPARKTAPVAVDLAGAGHYRAVRDRTYHLTDIAAAHHYVDTGHKRGAVVVRITSSEIPAHTVYPTEGAVVMMQAPLNPRKTARLTGWLMNGMGGCHG
jgi:hypothetical protein